MESGEGGRVVRANRPQVHDRTSGRSDVASELVRIGMLHAAGRLPERAHGIDATGGGCHASDLVERPRPRSSGPMAELAVRSGCVMPLPTGRQFRDRVHAGSPAQSTRGSTDGRPAPVSSSLFPSRPSSRSSVRLHVGRARLLGRTPLLCEMLCTNDEKKVIMVMRPNGCTPQPGCRPVGRSRDGGLDARDGRG